MPRQLRQRSRGAAPHRTATSNIQQCWAPSGSVGQVVQQYRSSLRLSFVEPGAKLMDEWVRYDQSKARQQEQFPVINSIAFTLPTIASPDCGRASLVVPRLAVCLVHQINDDLAVPLVVEDHVQDVAHRHARRGVSIGRANPDRRSSPCSLRLCARRERLASGGSRRPVTMLKGIERLLRIHGYESRLFPSAVAFEITMISNRRLASFLTST